MPLPIIGRLRLKNRSFVAENLNNLRPRTMICPVLGVFFGVGLEILDFPHAAERISEVGQATLAPDECQSWLEQQLHQLKHEGPVEVLAELQRLQTDQATLELASDNLAYLRKREAHMQYPTFQAQGLPIGSGVVESAHKVVIDTRLKGAGMHRAPDHVYPMAALRNLVSNDRWQED